MTVSDARKAHKILDDLLKGNMVLDEEREFLRNALPELPNQKTLEEITEHVRNAWVGASGNEWAGNSYDPEVPVESWLRELYVHLSGLTPAKSAHPEFLETEADYENAPEGTIAACDGSLPWHKFRSAWSSSAFRGEGDATMSGSRRRVLRWGEGK